MYTKKCMYCGKEFETPQPRSKYCCKYHAGKARNAKYKAKKELLNR